MRFLFVVSLAAVAILMVSRKKAGENNENEESDYDDETITDEYAAGYSEDERSSYSDKGYSEPSSLTTPATNDGARNDFNRPEYASENEPIMEIDADTDKRESLMSGSNKMM